MSVTSPLDLSDGCDCAVEEFIVEILEHGARDGVHQVMLFVK
jgi:hypothetical protein